MNTSSFTKRSVLIAIVALAAASMASAGTKLKTKSNNTNERAVAEETGAGETASRSGWRPAIPGKHGTLHVGTRSGTNGIEVAVALSGGASFAWNPATGGIGPAPVDNISPTTGIGVVVKKNPGSSAARTLPVKSDGSVELPADLEDGRYDLTLSVPRQTVGLNAIAKGRTAQTASFALILTKSSAGFVLASAMPDHSINTKGTGSTLARDAASGMPTGRRAAVTTPSSIRGATVAQPQADHAITTKGSGAI